MPTPLSAFDNLGKAYLAFARDEPASYTVMFETGVLPGGDGEALTAAEASSANSANADLRNINYPWSREALPSWRHDWHK